MNLADQTLARQSEPPALVDPPTASRLPLTAGDRALAAEAPPEHARPVSIFIFLNNLSAVCLLVGAIIFGVGSLFAIIKSEPGVGITALLSVGMALGFVVQHTLVQHLKHFSRWGWYGAMIELALLLLDGLLSLFDGPADAAVGAVAIVVGLLWMRSFWERRADFDVDIGVDPVTS